MIIFQPRVHLFFLILFVFVISACVSEKKKNIEPSNAGLDITGIVLTERSSNPDKYVNKYYSMVRDIKRKMEFQGQLEITVTEDEVMFTSNSIPNHNFNNTDARFAHQVKPIEKSYSVTRNPTANPQATELTLRYDNAIFLNGIKLDLIAAACYGVGPDPLGQEKIGCYDASIPWRYEPMSPLNGFGTDDHNAHTQPDGIYHYHGNPLALYDTKGMQESGVIGFAADGFPIFGPYINDNGTIRQVRSSYALKTGSRVSLPGEKAFPGGRYDGTYRDDYQYLKESGDLDEHNGMTRNGVYGYYITNSYPWVMASFRGTPHESFQKSPPGNGPPPKS